MNKNLPEKFGPPLEASFSNREIPLLLIAKSWAKEDDTVFPEKPLPGQMIDSWAPSQIVQEYATRHQLPYAIPPWDVVMRLQSKGFAHTLSPLPNSRILHDEADLQTWLKTAKEPFVFKPFYGFSGVSHRFKTHNLPFPVVAEPWVSREFDFSTQWYVDKNGPNYLGATKLLTTEKGRYLGNIVSTDEKTLFHHYYPFLQQHIAFVRTFLKSEPDFFGSIGFDAFVYNNQLQTICEINVRKTMGWVALRLLHDKKAKKLQLLFGKNIEGISLIPEKTGFTQKNKNPFPYQLKFAIE